MRAKSIQNKVTVNQTRSVEELENLLLRAENAIDAQYTHIQALTAQLIAYKEEEEDVDGEGGGMYKCTYMHTYIHSCMHTRIYTRTYAHTYTYAYRMWEW